MTIERQDIRAKLSHTEHAQLKAIAEVDNRDLGEIIEEVVSIYIAKRVNDATLLADKLSRAGISGNRRD